MRIPWLSALILASAAALAAIHAAQTAQTPPPQPRSSCYRLRFYRVEGQEHEWARILTGDKWISGCVGPDGPCYAPVWVPC